MNLNDDMNMWSVDVQADLGRILGSLLRSGDKLKDKEFIQQPCSGRIRSSGGVGKGLRRHDTGSGEADAGVLREARGGVQAVDASQSDHRVPFVCVDRGRSDATRLA